ncbi:MAG: oligopeptide/dipeptide ABC transporter ATP-binding protein [Pseudomonadota bacterium]
MSAAGAPLLEVKDLTRHFDVSPPWITRALSRTGRRIVKAVDGVSLAIPKGATVGLVGESGCGKSTLARMIAGLIAPTAGTMTFDGRAIDLASNPDAPARRAIQMIFQDPYASLNPRWTVEEAVGDPLLSFAIVKDRRQMRQSVADLLDAVGLSPDQAQFYPHAFSGGQRQRIAIARAIASHPTVLVADEPTSALDVSVQAQILNLLRTLQRERGLTTLFISHNLAVVDHMADIVGVMYLGRLVELQRAAHLFSAPRHPYTKALIGTVPTLASIGTVRAPLAGEVPNPIDPPEGCAFHPRCPHARALCREQRPPAVPLKDGGWVACHAVASGEI